MKEIVHRGREFIGYFERNVDLCHPEENRRKTSMKSSGEKGGGRGLEVVSGEGNGKIEVLDLKHKEKLDLGPWEG